MIKNDHNKMREISINREGFKLKNIINIKANI